MSTNYKTVLLKGGASELGKELETAQPVGRDWRLHSVLNWGDKVLAIYIREDER